MFVNREFWKIFVVALVVILHECARHGSDAIRILNVRNNHKVQPRSLIFPPTTPTRVQFIGGIGIPVEDLHLESVTSGYVLKAEYFLPTLAEEFRQKIKPQTIHRRRRSGNGTYTRDFFDDINSESEIAMEEILRKSNLTNNFGDTAHQKPHKGNYRLKKQAGIYRWIIYKAIEMALNNSALSGQACLLRSICEHAAMSFGYESGLLSEILHIILTPSTSQDSVEAIHRPYLNAEMLGYAGGNCSDIFRECRKSPMEIISIIFDN